MGDAANVSPHVLSTLSTRSAGRRWEDMILPGRKDPRNCADLAKSERDQHLGKIESVFSLYDKMRWKWDAAYLSTPGSPEYILRIAHSTFATHVYPYTHHSSLTIYLAAVSEQVWRCTWRPRSGEMRDALGGRDSIEFGDALVGRGRVTSEMHLEAVIDSVWRFTGRPRLSELRDVLWGPDRASLEMQLEAEIEWTESCTWRTRWSEFGDVLAGYDWARLEEY